MTNYKLIESVARYWINGQHKQAVEFLQTGCKSKPLVFAARCMRVHSELLGLGRAGSAEQFTKYIEILGDQ